MWHWKKILIAVAISALALLVLYIAFYFVFLDLVVDFWWFTSLNFEGYFWLRLLYRYFISGGITLLFFLIFFLNFWFASRFLGLSDDPAESPGLIKKFQSGALDVYTLLSVILAIVIAIPFYNQWESALLFLYAPNAGLQDPFFGNDVSFYMFNFPIFQLIQGELLVTLSLLFLFIGVLYWLEHYAQSGSKKISDLPVGAKTHLHILIVLVFAVIAWGFMLDRYDLLYTDAHEPTFFGPGFVEIRYHLPLIWTALAALLGAAISLMILIHTRASKGRLPLITFSLLCVGAIGLRYVSFFPNLIDQFIVQPNPVRTEKSFMANNIKATLSAYDLDEAKTIDFEVTLSPENDLSYWVNEEHLQSIPVWDRELLDDVYYQFQGLRPYYSFPTVDEDRYLIDGKLVQVNLAAREMNIEKLPPETHTWENKHLRYTHGYAGVMSPAAQDGGQPIEWYLRDLKLNSSVGITIGKPDIFYGMESYAYAIVPNKLSVIGIAGTDVDAMKNYSGKGGVSIHSFFRKMLFAFYFKEEKIFFSTNVSRKSKILFRRNIIDRIETLAPYLALDKDPYVVATSSNLFWIQDAYTLSDWYPVSKPSNAQFYTEGENRARSFNYIRNSVKIVVNAFDGTVDFYIADPKDPIIRAYAKAYPGVFKPLSEIPAELESHLRYPRDIYHHQMHIYSKYHQKEPELFYQQAETWEEAKIQSEVIKPYYLTTEIQGCGNMRKFVLIDPMTPIGRDNLSVLAIAGSLDPEQCGGNYTQRMVMFKFHKDIQVNGPAQVSALIDQDTTISSQFTLWDQHGSTVHRGRMIILPVGTSVLYVQPVYLISTQTRIPELVRIIVSMGNEVVMEKSLVTAFKQLEEKLRRGKTTNTEKTKKPAASG
ncbi:MAG: UPF0182 family protein [Methylococcales bacterium]